MLRTDRLCVWIMIMGLTFLVPSYSYVKFNDEICSMSLFCVAALDCLVNGAWRRYRLLFFIVAVMCFYTVYTLIFKSYNTPGYVLMDGIIEIKPYIPFAVFFAVRPSFTRMDKSIVKTICTVNAAFVSIALFIGADAIEITVYHISYIGLTLFISAMLYLFCSIREDGSISVKVIAVALLMLTVGLGGTRSKYYGIYVLSLFFLFAYRPGMLRSFSVKNLIIALLASGLVVAVAWSKIDFYYLSGGSGKFDPNVIESFARPVLYVTSGLIFVHQFPFGSGLASFASFASQQNYSTLYYEYGINRVHGLSPEDSGFICDAFFPSLAQFGVAGVALFIAFWTYAYSFIRRMIRVDGTKFRYAISIGALLILHILIECTSGNTFTQPSGMLAMCLLGVICGQGAKLAVPDEGNLSPIAPISLRMKKI